MSKLGNPDSVWVLPLGDLNRSDQEEAYQLLEKAGILWNSGSEPRKFLYPVPPEWAIQIFFDGCSKGIRMFTGKLDEYLRGEGNKVVTLDYFRHLVEDHLYELQLKGTKS